MSSTPLVGELEMTRPDRQVMWVRRRGMSSGTRFWLMVLPDLHLDNKKCQRKLLKKHLDFALEHQIPVILLGDILDVMGAKRDPRQLSTEIDPAVLAWEPKERHTWITKVSNDNEEEGEDEGVAVPYFAKAVGFAADFLRPYSSVLLAMTYGNHETAILKHHEIDPLRMLARDIGLDDIRQVLPYQCYLSIIFEIGADLTNKGKTMQRNIALHHGYGGGGVKTKGLLPIGRTLDHIGMPLDALVMGHFHEGLENRLKRTYMDRYGRLYDKEIAMIIAGCYKNEGKGGMGYHVEKGRPPKPLGGVLLEWQLVHPKLGPTLLFRSQHLSDSAPMPVI